MNFFTFCISCCQLVWKVVKRRTPQITLHYLEQGDNCYWLPGQSSLLLILPLLLASFPFLLTFILFYILTLTLLFIFHFLLSLYVISSPAYSHPSPPLSHPPILSLSIHPSLPPMWMGRSDLYLSGMDESQVWFKCPNYSPELWCPAPGYVAPSLWLSYESWHGTTEPFTEARLRAPSHEQFSPCTRPWKADGWCGKLTTWKHPDLLWSDLSLLYLLPYVTHFSSFSGYQSQY